MGLCLQVGEPTESPVAGESPVAQRQARETSNSSEAQEFQDRSSHQRHWDENNENDGTSTCGFDESYK